MPTLFTADGAPVQVPPGVRQRDLDAEHDALAGLGLIVRATADQAIARGRQLDILTRAPAGRPGPLSADAASDAAQLTEILAEAVSDALALTADGERALMTGAR